MDWSLVISLVISLVNAGPSIIAAYDGATSKTAIQKAAAVVHALPANVVQQLAALGAAQFPKLDPALHAVAVALTAVHPTNTLYAQTVLNLAHDTGWLTWTLPNGKPDLTEDGKFGPNTFAAVQALQVKLRLPVNGFIGTLEYMALQRLDAGVAAA